MNEKKRRAKEKKRARKLAQQAWDAADEGNLQLALKIIRRATDADSGNPVLWNDQGVLLEQYGRDSEAAEAFQCALSLAPSFSDAYSRLAAVRARQGLVSEAAALQAQAVKHSANPQRFSERLHAYQAMAGIDPEAGKRPISQTALGPPENCSIEAKLRSEFPKLAAAVDGLNWDALGDSLTVRGFASTPKLLAPSNCRTLREMFANDQAFSRTVVMDKEQFGRGCYRYFASPLPPLVDALRRIVYSHVARIANSWQKLLHKTASYPIAWEGFRLRCAETGQTKPTPILLRYEEGGFNSLHRDVRGDVVFPIQLAVILSSRWDAGPCRDADGFQGGEFLLCDDPPGKNRRIEAGLGDAVLFCTRSRLVRIGGVYGLQPVLHGVAPIIAGTRYVLGIPFHEYR